MADTDSKFSAEVLLINFLASDIQWRGQDKIMWKVHVRFPGGRGIVLKYHFVKHLCSREEKLSKRRIFSEFEGKFHIFSHQWRGGMVYLVNPYAATSLSIVKKHSKKFKVKKSTRMSFQYSG